MKLATIGALLSFALEREKDSLLICHEISERNPALTKVFEELRILKTRHLKTIEQARRENVTEMILEPIEGLDGDDYPPPVRPATGATASGCLSLAAAREREAARWLAEAAGKVKQRDVARILQKISQEKRGMAEKLSTVTGG